MNVKRGRHLTRASVAEMEGINPETLRYYEREGLLHPPLRNANGYRIYGDIDLNRLKFISRSKALGFSLRNIKEFIELTSDSRTPRKELRDLAKEQLRLIREKLRDLRALEKTLAGLVADCDGKGPIKGCPIADFVVKGESTKSMERKSSCANAVKRKSSK